MLNLPKRLLLFVWYLIGVVVSFPAIIYLFISFRLGLNKENNNHDNH